MKINPYNFKELIQNRSEMVKISIFSLYPTKATRVQLEYKSLQYLGYDVEIVTPIIPKGFDKGPLGTLLRYLLFMFQMLFHKTDIIHFSNIPDYPAAALLFRRKPIII